MDGNRNGFQDWVRRAAAAAGPWLRKAAGALRAGGDRLRSGMGRLRRQGHLGGQVDPRAEAGTLKDGMDRIARAFGLRGWRSGVAVAASGVAVLLVVSMALGGRTAPRLMPGPQVPEVIGFCADAGQADFADVQAHHAELNTVLAFWYSVDGNGTLTAHQPSATMADWVASHHMRMGVLINNIAGASGNNGGMLTDPTARATAVRNIAQMVRQQGYQDVNIDFELLKPNVRTDLTRFITDLRQALPQSVRLSVSVFPPVGVPSSINGAYNYTALAKVTNYLVIMLYDHHYDGGPAGAVSPDGWVRSNVRSLLRKYRIPASKLVLAVGVYGYDWVQGSTHASELPLNTIDQLRRAHGATVHRSQGNPFFRYTARDGSRHVVWYQDARMVQYRLQLAEQFHLHGVALWALGQETPAVWAAIRDTYGTLS